MPCSSLRVEGFLREIGELALFRGGAMVVALGFLLVVLRSYLHLRSAFCKDEKRSMVVCSGSVVGRARVSEVPSMSGGGVVVLW